MQTNTDLVPIERYRPPRAPCNSNNHKPPKKWIKARKNREKARIKGFENEIRFLDITKRFEGMWPKHIIGFEKATLKEDLFQSTDAWCNVRIQGRQLRVRIQVKSSYKAKLDFLNDHPDGDYVVVVVHCHLSDRDVFREFLFELNKILDVFKQ